MNDQIPRLMLNLIGPGTLAVFGAGFLWAWSIEKRRHYLLMLAAACLLFSAGIATQVLSLPPDAGLNALLSNFFYTAAVIMAAGGLLRRAGQRPSPWLGLAILALFMGLIFYFFYVERSLAARIYVQNFGFGAILLGTALRLRSLARGPLMDRVLFWTLLVFSLQFFPRTLLTAPLVRQADPARFGSSPFWLALQFSLSVVGAALALTVLLAALSDLIEDLRRERDMDRLTGVLNRRGFEERSAALLRRAGREPSALILIDLDHFKRINDTYGHQQGDHVLRDIGTLLRHSARRGDLVCRLGGEEFAMLMPGADLEGAQAAAERLRAVIAAHRFPLPALAEPITASFGLAQRRPGEPFAIWFDRADAALYAAKAQGRNRAVPAGL
ncbi:GGDEF domain-containing protein [Devosia elaeis]|uniref:diguanylate cyclase n=1 Tax=Devosia elaeis TaxID=1770058 RepID=A0A178HSR4_9HYPH|nr:GGDEF domain-containing protein [Devosia elaeis]OAM75891.1 diguanylate cyclase [Devosia elaeis]